MNSHPCPTISDIVPILADFGQEATQAATHQAYLDLLCNHLGVYLAYLTRNFPNLAQSIEVLISHLTDDQIKKWLALPEISHCLFYRRDESDLAGHFLRNSLLGFNFQTEFLECTHWLEDGAYVTKSHQAPLASLEYVISPIEGIPVDCISPYALKIAIHQLDGAEVGDEQISLFTQSELHFAFGHLQDAVNTLNAINIKTSAFVRRFTKAIILRKDSSDLNSFSSASSGQYVGRSLFVNAHKPEFSGPLLIDAIVHEAIHSILYMVEKHYPWLLSRELFFDRSATVISPWSGRTLRLRPFLQANFVWFGLLNFWNNPVTSEIYGHERAAWYRKRARSGFLADVIRNRLTAFQENIDAELLSCIDLLQQSAKNMPDAY